MSSRDTPLPPFRPHSLKKLRGIPLKKASTKRDMAQAHRAERAAEAAKRAAEEAERAAEEARRAAEEAEEAARFWREESYPI